MTIDWTQMPPGIVFGLKHHPNQISMTCSINGRNWDPVVAWKFKDHPAGFRAQVGCDLYNRSGGVARPVVTDHTPIGFYWFVTYNPNFPFPSGDLYAWANGFPPGLVFGLKHSDYGDSEAFSWMTGRDAFERELGNFDPADAKSPPPGFEKWNGGDLGGDAGVGFYWHETDSEYFTDWNIRLPSGLVFCLKHSSNQPAKKFKWGGNYWDPVTAYKFDYSRDRERYVPEGFLPRHGGDLGGSRGEGFYWFESQ